MCSVDQLKNQSVLSQPIGQYHLLGYSKREDRFEEKVSQLKSITNAPEEVCKNALKESGYNLNNAALLLLDGNTKENSNPPQKKAKIQIGERIQKEFRKKLNFFEISQVLLMCNNNENEAISILRTMV